MNNKNSNQSFQKYRDSKNRDHNYSNSYSRPNARTNNQNRQQRNFEHFVLTIDLHLLTAPKLIVLIHNPINVTLRALSDKANLHLPLITININNSLMKGSSLTPLQYAFGTCVNVGGRVTLNEVSNNYLENSVFETKIFTSYNV